MIPLMSIFSLLSQVPALFDAGRDIIEQVTGAPSKAVTPEDLRGEVDALPADGQAKWADAMKVKTEQYQAETARLANEQGDIADLVGKVDEKTAGKIAWLRMATRPRVVLRMSHVLLLPVYVFCVDLLLALINVGIRFAHSGSGEAKQLETLAATFFAEGSVYQGLYGTAAPAATTIVITYMTLRQIQKAGHPNPLASAGNAIKGMLGVFRK